MLFPCWIFLNLSLNSLSSHTAFPLAQPQLIAVAARVPGSTLPGRPDRAWCCSRIKQSLVPAALGECLRRSFFQQWMMNRGFSLELPALNCWAVLELALAVAELKSL